MVFILVGEVLNLHSILGQLSKFQQTLLEFARLLSILLNLLILLLVHDLILQSTFHDTFSDLFDALDEQTLEFILLADFVYFFKTGSFSFHALLMNHSLQVSNCLIVVGFQQ